MKNLGKFNGRDHPCRNVATAISYYMCFALVANLSRLKIRSLLIKLISSDFVCPEQNHRYYILIQPTVFYYR